MAETAELLTRPATELGPPKKPEISREMEQPGVVATKEVRLVPRPDNELRSFRWEFYNFNLKTGEPIKVVFKGREEIIDPAIIKEKHTALIGKKPFVLPEDKWERWLSFLDGKGGHTKLEGRLGSPALAQFASDRGLTLIVNQSPEAIMEAALLLGSEDPKVREFYHQARKFQYSEDLLALIDKAVAAHIYNTDGEKNKGRESHDGEAMLLAAMLGDRESSDTLDRLKDRWTGDVALEEEDAKQHDKVRHKEYFEYIAGLRKHGVEPLKIEDLVAVHVTRFYPYFDEKTGKWKVQTLFNSLEGKYARSTLHFTLNHVVTPNWVSGWNEAPIAIVVPLKKLIEANGPPGALNGVDTFWNLNPGQDLLLPKDAWILAPGRVGEKEPYSQATGGELSRRGQVEGINKLNYRAASLKDWGRLQYLKRGYRRLESELKYIPNSDIFYKAQKAIDQQQAAIGDYRNKAVESLIKSQGFEVIRGGEVGWVDEKEEDYKLRRNARLKLLAEDLRLSSYLHRDTAENKVENAVEFALSRVAKGETPAEEHLDLLRMPEVPLQQRRMLWAIGAV